MIEVELRRVPEGARDYVSAAALRVEDDGTYHLEDPELLFPVDLHVLVVDEDDQMRKVMLQDDPATWARNLGTVLRTGYLVPVVVEDSDDETRV